MFQEKFGGGKNYYNYNNRLNFSPLGDEVPASPDQWAPSSRQGIYNPKFRLPNPRLGAELEDTTLSGIVEIRVAIENGQ
jgi:hypothetical protein